MEILGFVFGLTGTSFGLIAFTTGASAGSRIKELKAELDDLRKEVLALKDGGEA